MLEFLLITISVISGFFIPSVPAPDDVSVPAFSYGSAELTPSIATTTATTTVTTTATATATTTTNLLFVGDIMLARNVEILMKNYGQDYPFAEIKSLTETADFTIGNF